MDLETDQPLDQSLLWRWKDGFYAERGAEAWASGTVPWRITSTPLLANAFADVLMAWSVDLRAAGRLRAGQPLCLVDLGAGAGRLSFLLARALQARGVAFRLVMTDVAAKNRAAWRAHPQLGPLFDAGCLDVAHLDALDPGELSLECSGETWRPGALPGPLAVVATYLFDSLPHQLWRVRRGVLEEGRVSLSARAASPPLAEVTWTFAFRPAPRPAPFLTAYAARLGEGSFLLPVGAMRCLDGLARLASGPLLCLAADKGPRLRTQLARVPFPGLARHGCVSASVNFHALRAWAGWRTWLEARAPSPALGVYGLAQGVDRRRLEQTRAAFAAGLGDDEPLKAQALVDAVAARGEEASAAELLSALRATHDSPDAVVRLAPALRAVAPRLSSGERLALVAALERTWANHFELAEEADVAFELAAILHRAGALPQASLFYGRSILTRGEHPTSLFDLALCRLDLGQPDEGQALLERVLELAPGHEKALRVLATVTAPRAAGPGAPGRPPVTG